MTEPKDRTHQVSGVGWILEREQRRWPDPELALAAKHGVVISHPGWWVEQPDELADALKRVLEPEPSDPHPQLPSLFRSEPPADPVTHDDAVLTQPRWWLDHMDELVDGLRRAARDA